MKAFSIIEIYVSISGPSVKGWPLPIFIDGQQKNYGNMEIKLALCIMHCGVAFDFF